MPVYTLAILATLALHQRGHPGAAGLVSGVATVTRADGVLVLVVMLVHLIAERQWRRAKRAVVGFGLAAVPWYLFAWVYFRTPFPATLAAKQAQHRRVGMPGFSGGFIDQLHTFAADPRSWVVAALALLGTIALFRRRAWPALLQWSLLFLIAYTGLGVGAYHWDYGPLVPAGVWLVIAGVTELGHLGVRAARALAPAPMARHAMAWLCAGLLAVPVMREAEVVRQFRLGLPEARVVVYEEVGNWLRAQTPARSCVGALEVGIIGYYSRRPVVDFAGLVQPAVSRAPGRSYVDWTVFAIQRYQPEYLALIPPLSNALEPEAWFQRASRRVHAVARPGYGPVGVYERIGADGGACRSRS